MAKKRESLKKLVFKLEQKSKEHVASTEEQILTDLRKLKLEINRI